MYGYKLVVRAADGVEVWGGGGGCEPTEIIAAFTFFPHFITALGLNLTELNVTSDIKKSIAVSLYNVFLF